MSTLSQVKAARRMGNRYLRKAEQLKAQRKIEPARIARGRMLDYYTQAAAMIAAHKQEQAL